MILFVSSDCSVGLELDVRTRMTYYRTATSGRLIVIHRSDHAYGQDKAIKCPLSFIRKEFGRKFLFELIIWPESIQWTPYISF